MNTTNTINTLINTAIPGVPIKGLKLSDITPFINLMSKKDEVNYTCLIFSDYIVLFRSSNNKE